jgi:hypothetical protein
LVGPIADKGIQPPAGGDQKGEARAGLCVTDADIALFIKRLEILSLKKGV